MVSLIIRKNKHYKVEIKTVSTSEFGATATFDILLVHVPTLQEAPDASRSGLQSEVIPFSIPPESGSFSISEWVVPFSGVSSVEEALGSALSE